MGASIQRTYCLYRTLGLRFLCVVNHNNQVVGIITRKDLSPESLRCSLQRGKNAHNDDELDHQDSFNNCNNNNNQNDMLESALLSSASMYGEREQLPIELLNSQFT